MKSILRFTFFVVMLSLNCGHAAADKITFNATIDKSTTADSVITKGGITIMATDADFSCKDYESYNFHITRNFHISSTVGKITSIDFGKDDVKKLPFFSESNSSKGKWKKSGSPQTPYLWNGDPTEDFYAFVDKGGLINKITITYDPSTAPTLPSTVTLNISNVGYSTLSSAYPLDFSSIQGLETYAVTEFNQNKAKIQELDLGIIQANTAVLIKGAPGEYKIPVAIGKPQAIERNLLWPTSNCDVMGNGTQYILTYKKSSVGFIRVRKNTKIAKNRGYLVLDGNEISTSKEFVAIDGATTDIKHAEYNHTDDEATAYDLTGKPIGKAAKGIVIINNKKIIRR